MGSSWSTAAVKPAPNGYLTVEGTQITLDGKPFVLKGAALGGWSGYRYIHRIMSGKPLSGLEICEPD
jgi:hypothetical protein